MKEVGIFTYLSMYCNFTNYGTVLQAWALAQSIKKLGYTPIVMDYCPNAMLDKDPLNPYASMWDKDKESLRLVEASMPGIQVNYKKIKRFYKQNITMSAPLREINEPKTQTGAAIRRFVCGSDSIWDDSEFGLDDAFWAVPCCMKKNSIAYAPSFQDAFDRLVEHHEEELIQYLNNFKSIGVRDEKPLEYIINHTDVDVARVSDPTLLLTVDDYRAIMGEKREDSSYLLYYSRRYNAEMEAYVYQVAKERQLKIVEISLRASNNMNHTVEYGAGIEEFLSLLKHADCVVTNSYHCIIFSLLFHKEFWAFSRAHCYNKIYELLARIGLKERLLDTGYVNAAPPIDWVRIDETLKKERESSLRFLSASMELLFSEGG